MQSLYFYAAGAISGVWLLVHLFLGGREVARPLLASVELDPMVRDVQYLCWHFTSVGIAGIALFYVLAAMSETVSYAVAGTVLAAGFTVTGVGLVIKQKAAHLKVPQGCLFLPVALFGVLGLLA